MYQPQRGDIYKHKKHDPSLDDVNYTYTVVEVVFDTGIDDLAVVYKPRYVSAHLNELGLESYVRPLKMFLEEVEWPDGEMRPRFVKIEE